MADINKAYSWAIQTCNAPNVGYSQRYRNQQTIGGITFYDCSSFINYALLAGGFKTPSYAPSHNAFTTYTQASELIRLGFTEVNANGEILPGDIGLSSGHTEMCYKGGTGKAVFMGAHTDNAPLANQVSIGSSGGNPNYERSFPRLFRYGSGGATGYGVSIYVVSALAGNSWRESHINPALSQIGGTAYGMFQWDGSRKTALFNWLSSNGYSRIDGDAQLQYLIVENDWIGTSGGISSLTDFLQSPSIDISLLTTAFCNCWERPGVPALQERIEFANDALDFISENANNSNINSWEIHPENGGIYLSRQQALRNAVMMYRYLSAGGGGGGTPGSHINRMPVWMMIRYHI
jgi:hypothetical protein